MPAAGAAVPARVPPPPPPKRAPHPPVRRAQELQASGSPGQFMVAEKGGLAPANDVGSGSANLMDMDMPLAQPLDSSVSRSLMDLDDIVSVTGGNNGSSITLMQTADVMVPEAAQTPPAMAAPVASEQAVSGGIPAKSVGPTSTVAAPASNPTSVAVPAVGSPRILAGMEGRSRMAKLQLLSGLEPVVGELRSVEKAVSLFASGERRAAMKSAEV